MQCAVAALPCSNATRHRRHIDHQPGRRDAGISRWRPRRRPSPGRTTRSASAARSATASASRTTSGAIDRSASKSGSSASFLISMLTVISISPAAPAHASERVVQVGDVVGQVAPIEVDDRGTASDPGVVVHDEVSRRRVRRTSSSMPSTPIATASAKASTVFSTSGPRCAAMGDDVGHRRILCISGIGFRHSRSRQPTTLIRPVHHFFRWPTRFHLKLLRVTGSPHNLTDDDAEHLQLCRTTSLRGAPP